MPRAVDPANPNPPAPHAEGVIENPLQNLIDRAERLSDDFREMNKNLNDYRNALYHLENQRQKLPNQYRIISAQLQGLTAMHDGKKMERNALDLEFGQWMNDFYNPVDNQHNEGMSNFHRLIRTTTIDQLDEIIVPPERCDCGSQYKPRDGYTEQEQCWDFECLFKSIFCCPCIPFALCFNKTCMGQRRIDYLKARCEKSLEQARR